MSWRNGTYSCALATCVFLMSALALAEEIGGQTYTADKILSGANTWANGATVTLNPNVTLTLDAGATLSMTAGGTLNGNGSGILKILGTWNYSAGVPFQLNKDNGATVRIMDGGKFRFLKNGNFVRVGWGCGFEVWTNGEVEVALDNPTDTANIDVNWDGANGWFAMLGGTIKATVGNLIIQDQAGAPVGSAPTPTGGAIDVSSNAQVTLSFYGAQNYLKGLYTGSGKGQAILTSLDTDQNNPPVFDIDDGSRDPTKGGVLLTAGFGLMTPYPDGDALITRGKMVVQKHIAQPAWYADIFVEDTGSLYWTDLSNDYDIGKAVNIWVNAGGEMIFTQPGTFTRHHDWGGTVSIAGRLTAQQAGTVATDGPGTGGQDWWDIRNGGTMETAIGATLQVNTGMKFDGVAIPAGPQSLDSGNYLVAGTLDLNGRDNPGTVGPNKFTAIGVSATVTLIGPPASFDALNPAFASVAGTFGLRSGHHYTNIAAALTIASSATLEFGLNSPDTANPALTTNACLTATGVCTIADGTTIRILDCGGLSEGSYVLVAAGTLNATPTNLVLDISSWQSATEVRAELAKIGEDLILSLRELGTVLTVK